MSTIDLEAIRKRHEQEEAQRKLCGCSLCQKHSDRADLLAALDASASDAERLRSANSTLSDAYDRVRGALGALVDALPRCIQCGAVATRSAGYEYPEYCNEHGWNGTTGDPLPWADEVEAAAKALWRTER